MQYVRLNIFRSSVNFLIAGLYVIVLCILPNFNFTNVHAQASTSPFTQIYLSGSKKDEIFISVVTMVLTATDNGGPGIEKINYRIKDSGPWNTYDIPILFPDEKSYVIEYFSKSTDPDRNPEIVKEKSFTILFPTHIPTPTPTNTPANTPVPSNTPTHTPTPVPNTPTSTASPTPEVSQPQGMIGPPAPQLQQQDSQQQMQQQGQDGDVKSAFSDESGPGNIGSTPGSSTSGVIKIFVTVIALTISGVVGWMAIKSNAKVEVDQHL